MATVKSYEIWCDKCGATLHTYERTIRSARSFASRKGWAYRYSKEKKRYVDFCPECWSYPLGKEGDTIGRKR